ncbi:Aspartokinase [Variovorax sp. PBS-H4]|uniref:amino acid kinase family protein n=1 Tax=Variovorax sp. PBS-H4 TaxID=434008 RepID=UPI001318B2CC|nr:aspartate kinase [Variovorax sp. PBS-H4]VTU29404.1 Aspartokinase [Variovorax sp. PBS-H4]
MHKGNTNMQERSAWTRPTALQPLPGACDSTSVMMFDGSSFATREHFGPVCEWLRRRLDEGGPRHRILCVVSAPSGLTEQYHDTLLALNQAPSDRLVDAGLPLADSMGAVLFAAALEAHGIRATVALGNQIGLRTDTNYTRARLQGISLAALRRQLLQHSLVVVPGGQGSAARGGQTMWMGRNSAALSAIALAAALGQEEVEVYSDRPGVFSCDPDLVDSATLIPRLPYSQAIQMSTSGAKMLHHRALEHALQNRLRIVCRRNHAKFEAGTVLVADAAFQPAVVPDARSQTFEADIGTAEDAARQLAAVEVPHVLMPGTRAGMRRVVVTSGFFDAWHFLAIECQLPVTRQNTLLLTRVRLDGGVKRELVSPSALAARARELHDIHCTPGLPRTPPQTHAPSSSAQPLSARLAVLAHAQIPSHA